MNGKIYTVTNKSTTQVCTKLYLDARTSDVNFVVEFNADHSVTIPAHKSILSIGSNVFDAMFYGPMKEKGDIKIVDAPADAFEEFLQFFYLQKVRLTSKNVVPVTKLCHKYELVDGLKSCGATLQKSLTVDNVCTVYELAVLLELANTIKLCKQKIKEHPDEVLKSTGFMECNQETMSDLLELVTLQCNAGAFVNSCMAWARNKCEQRGVVITPENLRDEFDLFTIVLIDDILMKNLKNIPCTGYAAAVHLDLETVVKSYEHHIQQNPNTILKSDDFLKCDRKTLDKILELASSKCSPSTVVDASMAWAKAECVRNGLQETPAYLRAQLNDSFHRIPFSDLDKEQFSQHVSGYKRFFNEDDLETIIMQTKSKKAKRTETAEIIRCNLRGKKSSSYISMPFECTVKLNTILHLTEILIGQINGTLSADMNVNATITLRGRKSGQPLQLGNINLSSAFETKIIVPVPVVINPNQEYVLKIDAARWSRGYFVTLTKTVNWKQGDVEIKFSPHSGLISGLVFERPSA
ncbi:uncharacterized protein LOC116347390 [Contarinia nasturtii]|uniref:uncharacterized protein LOC116347390 n=1 Tax=Contarinia nasturtii TaxID=265458 RepID=UPI0012D3DBC4|nr:uncharacterized protein LOC116347390 [Contarinia nasturtii]